jgi:hypothetical protein
MRNITVLAVAMLSATACGRGEIVTGVTDSTFVHAMVALRRLPTGIPGDSAWRIRQRDSIFREFRVTPAQLESAAVRLSSQPGRAAALWRRIDGAATDTGR